MGCHQRLRGAMHAVGDEGVHEHGRERECERELGANEYDGKSRTHTTHMRARKQARLLSSSEIQSLARPKVEDYSFFCNVA